VTERAIRRCGVRRHHHGDRRIRGIQELQAQTRCIWYPSLSYSSDMSEAYQHTIQMARDAAKWLISKQTNEQASSTSRKIQQLLARFVHITPYVAQAKMM
jgi:hypothetical protein